MLSLLGAGGSGHSAGVATVTVAVNAYNMRTCHFSPTWSWGGSEISGLFWYHQVIKNCSEVR